MVDNDSLNKNLEISLLIMAIGSLSCCDEKQVKLR